MNVDVCWIVCRLIVIAPDTIQHPQRKASLPQLPILSTKADDDDDDDDAIGSGDMFYLRSCDAIFLF